MRLADLEAALLRYESPTIMGKVDDLTDAQGIRFLCPKCYAANNGPVGTHMVLCWFADRGVPAEASPGPGRWRPSGDSIETLSFVGPGATSVFLQGGCGWHGFVLNGSAK